MAKRPSSGSAVARLREKIGAPGSATEWKRDMHGVPVDDIRTVLAALAALTAERDTALGAYAVADEILRQLVLEMPKAAGFGAGCTHAGEVFGLVVAEHRRVKAER